MEEVHRELRLEPLLKGVIHQSGKLHPKMLLISVWSGTSPPQNRSPALSYLLLLGALRKTDYSGCQL